MSTHKIRFYLFHFIFIHFKLDNMVVGIHWVQFFLSVKLQTGSVNYNHQNLLSMWW